MSSALPYSFEILTLFPEMFESYLQASILGKAAQRELISVDFTNIRDFSQDKHNTVDDTPYGGGSGMVLKPDPVSLAIEAACRRRKRRVVLLTPAGRLFSSQVARELSELDGLIVLCGRYEGIDERVAENFVDDELSIGDYVLTGGELGALILIDAVSRFVPGVLGNQLSPLDESLSDGCLEYPHYTRPRTFRGHDVPEVLLSGDHGAIERWRRKQSLLRTRDRRPDLFARLKLTDKELAMLDEEAQ